MGHIHKSERYLQFVITEISPITPAELSEYAKIPIVFEVRSKLNIELVEKGLGGMKFHRIETQPYIKDYDRIAGNMPTEWLRKFDISNWGLFLIKDGEIPVAGVAVTLNVPEVQMEADLAVLWDLRVHPDYRGFNLGTRLFQKAVEWAKGRGCNQLRIATQNTNVPACEFYIRQGCKLGEANRFKYMGNSEIREEVELVWYIDL